MTVKIKHIKAHVLYKALAYEDCLFSLGRGHPVVVSHNRFRKTYPGTVFCRYYFPRRIWAFLLKPYNLKEFKGYNFVAYISKIILEWCCLNFENHSRLVSECSEKIHFCSLFCIFIKTGRNFQISAPIFSWFPPFQTDKTP